MAQFNTEQDRVKSAQESTNAYGLKALEAQAGLGAQERAIEQEGITADLGQFREERDFPLKNVQYMQSLLQGLPLSAQTNNMVQPSLLSQLGSGASGISEFLNILFGGGDKTTTTSTGTGTTTGGTTTTDPV